MVNVRMKKYRTIEELQNDVKMLFIKNTLLVPLDRILPPNANINSPHSIEYNPEYLFYTRYEEILYVLHRRYNWIINKTDSEKQKLAEIRKNMTEIKIKKMEIWREWMNT